MRVSLTLLGCIVFAVAAVCAATLPDWFDYQGCDFCKQWGSDPGLIAHTRDECRNISDGIVWITYVEREYAARFAKVQEAEERVNKELEAGKPLNLCQYCSRISSFGAKGVRIESVEGTDAFITLYTSKDTTIVRQLHEFGTQAIVEEAKANASFLARQKLVK